MSLFQLPLAIEKKATPVIEKVGQWLIFFNYFLYSMDMIVTVIPFWRKSYLLVFEIINKPVLIIYL